jgi:hypothetical protein
VPIPGTVQDKDVLIVRWNVEKRYQYIYTGRHEHTNHENPYYDISQGATSEDGFAAAVQQPMNDYKTSVRSTMSFSTENFDKICILPSPFLFLDQMPVVLNVTTIPF